MIIEIKKENWSRYNKGRIALEKGLRIVKVTISSGGGQALVHHLVKCVVCSNDFTSIGDLNTNDRTCSPECHKAQSAETYSKSFKGRKYPNRKSTSPRIKKVKKEKGVRVPWNKLPRVERTCLTCPTIFIVPINSDRKYCSQRCQLDTGRGYKSGIYHLVRLNMNILYRSSYELRFLEHIDKDNNIINLEYEKIRIPYIDSKGDSHTHIPDYLLTLSSGNKVLVEVKPSTFLIRDEDTIRKCMAAMFWAITNNISYSIIAEKDLDSVTTMFSEVIQEATVTTQEVFEQRYSLNNLATS